MAGIATHLGQSSAYKKNYDATLLVRELRQNNRTYLGLDSDNLPFGGIDAWNAYEVSAITDNGLPFSFVVKLAYPASSKYIVESKSLKLYFNSFAMTKCGGTEAEVAETIKKLAEQDLSNLLEAPVEVGIWGQYALINEELDSPAVAYDIAEFVNLETLPSALDIQFSKYSEAPEVLVVKDADAKNYFSYHSSSLVSCCKVTSQPDSGDIFIIYRGAKTVTPESLLEYIVSFRNENHFHEEICEAVWSRLYKLLEPEELCVACLYSRRGGIDINPIRWVGDSFDTNLPIADFVHVKLPRQ